MTNIKALYFPVFNIVRHTPYKDAGSSTHSTVNMLAVKYYAVDYGNTYYERQVTKVKKVEVSCKF